MARQIFIEPNIFLNPSLRVMPTLYKTLWVYMLTACDAVGVWTVDWEMASLAVGGTINPADARRFFLEEEDPKCIEIHNGKRWFLRKYIEFQHKTGIDGNSNWQKSARQLLEKHGICPVTLLPKNQPLGKPLHQPLHQPFNEPLTNPSPTVQVKVRVEVEGNTEDSYKEERTALSYQGGAGGNGIARYVDPPLMDDLTVTGSMHRMIAAYGATGRQANKKSICAAIRVAVTICMKRHPDAYPTIPDATAFLELQASKAREFDIRAGNQYRKGLEKWLSEECFTSDIELEPVIAPTGKKTSWKDNVEGF